MCREQHRRWRIGVGGCYRYLLGLAAAQIASAFLLIGLPRDPRSWEQQEYRLFSDMVRLERWRQALLLEQLLERWAGQPERWALTAAFEGLSDERERRIAAWRQCALLEMMGVRSGEEQMAVFARPDSKQPGLEISRRLRDPVMPFTTEPVTSVAFFGVRETLQSGVRILRDDLEYDRRKHESYRTA